MTTFTAGRTELEPTDEEELLLIVSGLVTKEELKMLRQSKLITGSGQAGGVNKGDKRQSISSERKNRLSRGATRTGLKA